MAQPGSDPTPLTGGRKARHILDNYFIGPARDPGVLEIWAYTDRFSYAPGETVGLRVSTTADSYDVEIGRDGAEYRVMKRFTGLQGISHDTPPDCSARGCNWPLAVAFLLPDDWPPGGYLVTLRGYRGAEEIEEHHLFLLRHGPEKARMVLVCATGTWMSYNDWGGSNAYEGIAGPDGRNFSPVLSSQRPWTRGFCKLPEGAPRALTEAPPRPGEMVRYPYMEWAYAYGYSKKYASAGWASYERHFARWAESEGYRLDFATQHDLDGDPGLLDGYALALFVGHDEYWSRPMRDHLDNWIEAGGRAARFAGNFLWQIRLEDEGRRQICFKHRAGTEDPVAGTGQAHLLSSAWEMPQINHPGALTFGANGARGVYAGLGLCAGRGPGGFTIYRPEHWAFDGAQIGYGDILGADSRIFGYEVDGLDHEIRGGLPYPTGTDGAAPEVTILGLGLACNIEADHGLWGEHLYIGRTDAEWAAHALFGSETEEAVSAAGRGSGAIVHWPRGKGEVFTAGTCEWVAGLLRGDRQVEQVTRNVLNRFLAEHRV